MTDYTLFGTEAFPLRSSGLRQLLVCPWKVVMRFIDEADPDEGGAAGDTGSAFHKAAAAYHRGNEVVASLQIMQENGGSYPLADLVDAANMFLCYAQDPRQTQQKAVLVEQPVAFQLQAHETDPTGAPIQVTGTVDLVREDEWGRCKVWDHKTSKKPVNILLQQHTFQIAAYCIGAAIHLGKPVSPGGLILPRLYRNNDIANSNVFGHYNFSWEDIPYILEPIRKQVADIRRGIFHHFPNDDCTWCHQRTPDVCRPKLIQLRIADAEAAQRVCADSPPPDA